jgi:hypothetical protein
MWRNELYASFVILLAHVSNIYRDGALRRAHVSYFGYDASHFIVAQ